jgi:hypothetical protein
LTRTKPGIEPPFDTIDFIESEPTDRFLPRSLRSIGLIVAMAYLLRLVWLFYAQTVPVSDFNDYRTLAADLLDHRQFGYPERTSFFLPMHPVLLSMLMLVSRSDLWLSHGTVLLSTASVALVYILGREVFSEDRPALLAASLVAFLPLFVLFSPVLATEHLFLVLMLLGLIGVLKAKSWRGMVLSGVAIGLAALTRGEAVFYIPAIAVVIWFDRLRDRVVPRQRLLLIVCFFGAFVGTLVPWTLRNATVIAPDAGLSASAGVNFYFAHNSSGIYGYFPEGSPLDGLPAAEASRLGWSLAFAYLQENPLRLFSDVRVGIRELFKPPDYALFWSTQQVEYRGDPNFRQKPLRFLGILGELNRVTAAMLVTLAVASLLAARWWPGRLWTVVLGPVVSVIVLRTVIYWAKPRYRFFMDVILTLLAGVTIHLLLSVRRPGEEAGRPAEVTSP